MKHYVDHLLFGRECSDRLDPPLAAALSGLPVLLTAAAEAVAMLLSPANRGTAGARTIEIGNETKSQPFTLAVHFAALAPTSG